MKIQVETEFSVPMKSEYKAMNSPRSAQKKNFRKKKFIQVKAAKKHPYFPQFFIQVYVKSDERIQLFER